jgi:D-beta-D-heptose 7-phosphate kinase/D-beta-D-heptose 1-phosphate adenosyltransferase
VIAHGQQLVRVDVESRAPLSAQTEEQILSWAETQLPSVNACVLSDYAKGVISTDLAREFISLARRANKPVIVDPKGACWEKYEGATVITPNKREAEQAANSTIHTMTDLMHVGRRLLEQLKGTSVLITRGPEGMSLFEPERDPYHVPAQTQRVFDVTGAGDTAVASLSLALAAGGSLRQAVQLANLAAGVVVAKPGTATCNLSELRKCVANTMENANDSRRGN